MNLDRLFRLSAFALTLAALGIGSFASAQIASGQRIPSIRVARPLLAATPPELYRGIPAFRYSVATKVAVTTPSRPAAAVAPAAPKPTPAPASPAPPPCGKSIDVDLTTQQLVAAYCGRVFSSTPITSGRPGLRTPTGTFAVFLKEQNVYFYSPWPEGDPNYYPPMFVAYAMEFLDGGFFLHTDPDEPAGAFGPGSEDGPYASHGCVHVPYAVMVDLYAWADDGTVVSIHY